MISATAYMRVFKAATQMDPYGKRLDEDTIKLMYLTLDEQIKQTVTDEMLFYAFKQHRLDPGPDKELNLEQQLMQHLFRCENGVPNYRWGIRQDLALRMAKADAFHGQTKSAYELGEDIGRNEPRLAPDGVLAQLAAQLLEEG